VLNPPDGVRSITATPGFLSWSNGDMVVVAEGEVFVIVAGVSAALTFMFTGCSHKQVAEQKATDP
jgi:hypothetical protein